MASDVGRASTRVPAERHGSSSVTTRSSVYEVCRVVVKA